MVRLVGETSRLLSSWPCTGHLSVMAWLQQLPLIPMTDLPNVWASIKADLHRARNLLPDSSPDQQSLNRYYELVEHNELELACDALEESASDRAVSREFWFALRDAATKMQLRENAARYERHAGEPISGT